MCVALTLQTQLPKSEKARYFSVPYLQIKSRYPMSLSFSLFGRNDQLSLQNLRHSKLRDINDLWW